MVSHYCHMSRRSCHSLFQSGEYVLCFEPDPSKAKVLYDAKILEVSFTRDITGKKVPEYLVHFQGWNASWDRVVPENGLLKYTTENQRLMRNLSNIARHNKMTVSKKKRIDHLVKRHFKKHKQENIEISDVSEDDEVVLDSDEENITGDDSHSEVETETDSVIDDGLDIVAGDFDLEIPDNLRKKLEDDCYWVRRKGKLLQLPANPNIISLLEDYVKNFACNVLCTTSDKLRPRDTYPPAPDKNIEMAKEVADGIRVMFDFTLPLILLYPEERSQYQKALSMFKPISFIKKEPESTESTSNSSTARLRSTVAAMKNGKQENLNQSSLANLQYHSPKPVIKTEVEEECESASEDEDDDDDDDEVILPRRFTRHAFEELTKRSPIKRASVSKAQNKCKAKKIAKSTPSKNDLNNIEDIQTRRSLRSSARLESPVAQLKETFSQDRATPPPPVLLPSNLANGSKSSRSSTPSLPDGILNDRETQLNKMLEWKMIPSDAYYMQSPTPPCVLYGAHHFLRLFVKLPEVVSQMPIPQNALKPLIKHFHLILSYLSEHCEKLLPASDYMDASEFASSRPSRKK